MKYLQELIETKLFKQQSQDWPLAKKNYALLNSALYKSVDFGDFVVQVQFNPERVRSVAANVCHPGQSKDCHCGLDLPACHPGLDPGSPDSRRGLRVKPAMTGCPLCPENRPPEQIAIAYSPSPCSLFPSPFSYNILLNPYPIFSRHLTIPDEHHLPQLIQGRMNDFLSLAKDLSNFSLLYNGAYCGASVPNHQHFQAIERNVLPIEEESLKKKKLISADEAGKSYHFPAYLRKVFLLESDDRNWICKTFDRIKNLLPIYEPEKEPRFNLIAQYNEPFWQLYIFPRTNHRPTQFFETDETQLLVSPGVVDVAGVLITVRETDFNRLDRALLQDIYRQISISDEEESQIIHKLKYETP